MSVADLTGATVLVSSGAAGRRRPRRTRLLEILARSSDPGAGDGDFDLGASNSSRGRMLPVPPAAGVRCSGALLARE